MSKAAPKIALLGYYGFGNLGDEAVLAGILTALSETIPEAQILVLSSNPDETRAFHAGVEAVNRWDWKSVWAALKGTDLFILGGGSLLQDATSSRSVLWYALMALMARKRARRVLWWGQGIGPLQSPQSRRLVRLIANQADALTVRDENSAQLLKEIGVRGSITTVADPAFALSPQRNVDFPRTNQAALLALRAWKNDVLGQGMKPVDWEALAHQTGTGLRVAPMHLPDDADYARSLHWGQEGMPPVLDWKNEPGGMGGVLEQFASAPLVIALRLHALIFAARCGVPFVAVSYDPKVDALASAAGQSDALVSLDDFSAETLRQTVAHVQATHPLRRAHLETWASAQTKKARLPAAIARDLL